MLRITAILTMLVALMAAPAAAQRSDGVGQAIGDILSGVLDKDDQTVRGHVVLASPTAGLIVRGNDDRSYTVDASAVPATRWQNLQPGQPVTLTAKPGASPNSLIASRIEPDLSGSRAAYEVTRGTVERVSGSQATVRTIDGGRLALDISSLPTAARPTPRESATIVYEAQAAPGRGTALWIQPEPVSSGTYPSASPSASPSAVPGAGRTATGAAQSGYERIHGYVQSVGVSSLTLKADNGQTIPVDTSELNPQIMASTRPGDIVSVVGQMTGTGFRASVLQKE